MNKKVFEKASIGGIELKNRLVRSATQEMLAKNHQPTPEYYQLYRDIAEGGVGLIISGYMTFSKTDFPYSNIVHLGSDDIIPDLKKLSDEVHGHGSKIIAQLNHTGSQILNDPGADVIAPSDVLDPYGNIKPVPATRDQIQDLIEEFSEAALRARKAGFDGIQIHAGHGYLFSKFLSPVYNRRTDAYGGSAEKRASIIVELLNRVRSVCGEDFPVWIKLNCEDFGFEDNSMDFETTVKTAKILERHGIDAIELSGGTSSGKHVPARSIAHTAYHQEYAAILGKEVDTPLILVGGFRNISDIESALAKTNVEAVSICRALIREPDLPKKWREKAKEKADCFACNGCLNPKGIKCLYLLDKKEREEQKSFLRSLRDTRS